MSESRKERVPKSRRAGHHLGDFVLPLIVAAVSSVYLFLTTRLKVPMISDPVGPRAFPYLVGAFGLVCAVWLAIENFRRKSRSTTAEITEQRKDVPDSRTLLIVSAVLLWSLVYYLAFDPLGFLISSAVYLFGLTMLFNRKAWLINVIFSVASPIVFQVAFSDFLGIILPNGPFGF